MSAAQARKALFGSSFGSSKSDSLGGYTACPVAKGCCSSCCGCSRMAAVRLRCSLHAIGADSRMHAKRRRHSETELLSLSVCVCGCLRLRAGVYVCTGMGGKSAISKYMKLANPGMFH